MLRDGRNVAPPDVQDGDEFLITIKVSVRKHADGKLYYRVYRCWPEHPPINVPQGARANFTKKAEKDLAKLAFNNLLFYCKPDPY